MKTNKANKRRTLVAVAVFIVLCIGLIAGISMGTLSGFGWDTISALCPMGAFTTMIATHTYVPRAVVSIIIMAVLILFLGRAFCGWICPVPVLKRFGNSLSSSKKRHAKAKAKHDI